MKCRMQNVECRMEKGAAGYSLLLALLITASVAAASSALARIIVAEIKQTRFVDNAIVAQAAAESGGELGLFLLRKTDVDITAGEKISESLENNAQTQWSAVPTEKLPTFSIKKNDFISFIIPQGAPMSENGLIQVVRWTPVNCDDSSWIEISSTAWDPDNNTFTIWRHPFSKSDSPSVQLVVSLMESKTINKYLTEVRIKALYCDIEELRITPPTLPSRVTIAVEGEYRGSKQAFNMIAPRSAPLGGLFDFVVFSEGELVK